MFLSCQTGLNIEWYKVGALPISDKEEILEMLKTELVQQKEIFKANESKVINPDNTPEYLEVKKTFDVVDKRIK